MRQMLSHPPFERLFIVLALAVLGALRAVAAPLSDGPYVTRQADDTWLAQWVRGDEAALRVSEEHLREGRPVVVPAVGALPELSVRLRAPAALAAEEVALPLDTPLFIVADTHGEYEILAELLTKHRIVDASLRWSFGRGQLVILGDVLDRGANQLEILWLIYQLQAEAAEAGGGVHLLLGNHEAMVLSGDLRYLNPKYARVAALLRAESYAELVGPRTVLGQWLRTRPAVLKIRDLLCLHGGISPQVVERGLTLQQLNRAVRGALQGPNEADRAHRELVMGPLGPLWYRGYFAEQKDFPSARHEDIDAIRKHFGVRAILVGHTTVPTVTALHGGRVIAVQVYPRREWSGAPVMEALRIDHDRFLRARIDGTLEPLEKPL
jgi:Calcineurin-like phosphoesterase